MDRLEPYFRINFKEGHMYAELDYTKAHKEMEENLEVDQETWEQFLASKNVVHGIKHQIIFELVEDPFSVEYPVIIAQGTPPERGEDGKVEFLIDSRKEMKKDEDWNFRDVMTIPSVKKGQRLAKIVRPTQGINGENVLGKPIRAVPGKPAVLRAGKNVVFNEADGCFYAAADGQFRNTERQIQVLPEFHVNETLSMEVGNLDFVGTIIIRGDVPTGFTVQAAGDVKIFGMVEAATVIAGGSIYITEGISGQGKGKLQAGENLQIGYINQADIHVGADLYVENSILHSDCVVQGHVFSQRGNIIGGTLSAGKTVEAKDIGTRMNTKTEIMLGLNKSVADKENSLRTKKQELIATLDKLKLLGNKLAELDDANPKVRVSKLRHRHSTEVVTKQLDEVHEELLELNAELGDITESHLIVRNFLYQNCIVAFGKYKRLINSNHHFVQLKLEDQEISIMQLFE